MKNHNLWMVLGCVLPLLLIFLLPVFGASGGEILFLFVILCFGIHLLMIGHHGGHSSDDENHHEDPSGGAGKHRRE